MSNSTITVLATTDETVTISRDDFAALLAAADAVDVTPDATEPEVVTEESLEM